MPRKSKTGRAGHPRNAKGSNLDVLNLAKSLKESAARTAAEDADEDQEQESPTKRTRRRQRGGAGRNVPPSVESGSR